MITLRQWLENNQLHPTDSSQQWLLNAPINDPAWSAWVVPERKTRADPSYRLGRALVHGFGRLKWNAWQQAKCPVWLVVAETLSGELIALRVDGQSYDYEFDGNLKGVDRGGMVYLRKSRFIPVASLASDAPGRPQQLSLDVLPAPPFQPCHICRKPNSPFGFGLPPQKTLWACRDHRAQVDQIWKPPLTPVATTP